MLLADSATKSLQNDTPARTSVASSFLLDMMNTV
jgi:hypothetical protein